MNQTRTKIQTRLTPIFSKLKPVASLVAQLDARSRLFTLVDGFNPLITAAAPLLYVLSDLRQGMANEQPMQWQLFLTNEIRAFERHAVLNDYPQGMIAATRYWLCLIIDEIVMRQQSDGDDTWLSHTLSEGILNESYHNERFIDFLQQLKDTSSLHIDMLELIYLSLTLGFEGNEHWKSKRNSVRAFQQNFYQRIRAQHNETSQKLAISQKSSILHKRRFLLLPWRRVLLLSAGVVLLFYLGSVALNIQLQQPVLQNLEKLRK